MTVPNSSEKSDHQLAQTKNLPKTKINWLYATPLLALPTLAGSKVSDSFVNPLSLFL